MKNDRRVTDRIGATPDTRVDLAERYFVRNVDAGLDTRTASALHVHARRVV